MRTRLGSTNPAVLARTPGTLRVMAVRFRFLPLVVLAIFGCDDDLAPRAIDLALGADQACFLGAVDEAVDGGGPVDAGVEDAGDDVDAGPTDPGVTPRPAGIPFCWGAGVPDVTPLEGGLAFTSLALGAFACGTDVTGALYCAGANSRGQLGDGTTTARTEPAVVPGVIALAFDVARFAPASAGFVCAITTTGTQCWGANDRGQLGDGATLDRASPSPIAGSTRFVRLALGGAHACGVDEAGALWCWGANDQGQLGDGTLVDRAIPTEVPGLEGVVEVAAGLAHTCARTAAGAISCWGSSDEGQAGTLVGPVLAPRAIELEGATALVSGARHACAIGADGRPRCWGANESLQTGLGVPVPQTSPVTVSVEATRIAAGRANTCVINRGGSILCWGAASTGMLGASAEADSAFPTRVPGTP